MIYTRKELIDEFRISKTTATKIFKELKECNLIKEERLGQSLPNRIYIGKIKSENIEKFKKRNFRSLKSELQEVQNSTSRSLKEYLNNTDKNNNDNIIEKKYFVDEKVSLYGGEIEKLVNEYGIDKTVKCIVELNLYKLSNGKEYSSDYDTILRWVVNRVNENEKKGKYNDKISNNNLMSYKNYEQRQYDNLESYYDNL